MDVRPVCSFRCVNSFWHPRVFSPVNGAEEARALNQRTRPFLLSRIALCLLSLLAAIEYPHDIWHGR
jgi:hypothetical protein